jgi:predicted amidohydrolase
MEYLHGDVGANLDKARILCERAIRDGATWIVLPELFTTGYGAGNNPRFLHAHRPVDGEPTQLLRELAKKSGGMVGGSFLAQKGGETYNTFVLADANGEFYQHDKDAPSTGDEASNFIGGTDDGVLRVRDNTIGAALCWELVRTRTATRLLAGKVDVILGGSLWGGSPDLGKGTVASWRELYAKIPSRFAALVGAPFVHANPVGSFVHRGYDGSSMKIEYFGDSQIVDQRGGLLAIRPLCKGEGHVIADVNIGHQEPQEAIPQQFWLPDHVPEAWNQWFFENTKAGQAIYREVVKPTRLDSSAIPCQKSSVYRRTQCGNPRPAGIIQKAFKGARRPPLTCGVGF